MSVHTFRFSYRRRMKTALYPLALALALLGVHARWVHLGSWVSVAMLASVVLLVIRALQWVWGGRAPLRIDDQGLVRGGPRVPFKACEVHLRARQARNHGLRVDEAVVVSRTREGQRVALSFDVSLIDFEQALQILLGRVPEARVKVWAPGGKPVEGDARAQLLAPLRSPLAQAPAASGEGVLPPRPERPKAD